MLNMVHDLNIPINVLCVTCSQTCHSICTNSHIIKRTIKYIIVAIYIVRENIQNFVIIGLPLTNMAFTLSLLNLIVLFPLGNIR